MNISATTTLVNMISRAKLLRILIQIELKDYLFFFWLLW